MKRAIIVACVAVAGALLVVAGSRDAEPAQDDHQREVETVAALCRIGVALEEYSIDHDRYPQASSLEALVAAVVPRYAERLPEVDGWGNAFSVDSTPQQYTLASCGKGIAGDCTPAISGRGGESADPRTDTVFSNGVFLQWPGGVFGEFEGDRPGCPDLRN